MCGIFGIISPTPCAPILINGLAALRYRGYDSCGISLFAKKLHVFKSLDSPQDMLSQIPSEISQSATAGIAHTRWATHGDVSLQNAHPQISASNVNVVHNGVITNHQQLKLELEALGYEFLSQTDSECIAHLLDHLLTRLDIDSAMQALKKRLEGRFAIACMIAKAPGEIFALRHDMPLFVSVDAGARAISSDIHAFNATAQFASLPNNIAVRISAFEISVPLQLMPLPHLKDTAQTTHTNQTLSEIHEQPRILKNIEHYWQSSEPAKHIPIPKHIIIIGCGSSYHSGLLLQHWLRASEIFCEAILASEAKNNPLHYSKETLIIAISQSGETADTLVALDHFPKSQTLAICNVAHSSLTQKAQHTLYVQAGREIGVASTKAFTAQVSTLYMLSQHFLNKTASSTAAIVEAMQQVLDDEERVIKVAHQVSQFSNIICLGKHAMHPIAMEAALKLKELTYIHAEGLAIGEMKHGPLAMVDQHLLLIVLMPDSCPTIQTSIAEINARNGNTLIVGQSSSPSALHIASPKHPLSVLIANTALQLAAVHIALRKGLNVDQPRNLAKCVTVE